MAAPARIELTYCGSKPHALTVGLWGRIYKASFFCSRLRIRTPDLIFLILCVSATPIWKRVAVEALMELTLGIEPRIKVLQTYALPFGYVSILGGNEGIEPSLTDSQTAVLPLH